MSDQPVEPLDRGERFTAVAPATASVRPAWESVQALATRLTHNGSALFFYAVAFTGLVYVSLFLVHSRYFPYWDGAAYEQFTLSVADAFATSFGAGVQRVAASMSDDYNFMFTVPLVPFVDVFGRYRSVFIGAMYLIYFVPYMLLAALVARRVFPEHAREAGRVAAVATVLTPTTWWSVAIGYPDVGGAAIITAMLLLYERSQRAIRWRPLLAIGVLGALAILFRRHYVYIVFAVYAGLMLDVVWPMAVAPRERAVQFRAALLLAGAGAISAALVFMVAPTFVLRALGSGYQQSLASWQGTPFVIAQQTVATIGVVVLLIALAGMLAVRHVTVAGRPMARVLWYVVVIWAVVWIFYVRQGPYHYPHILPLVVVVGLTGAWLYLRYAAPWPRARYAAPALGALIAIIMLVTVPVTEAGTGWADRLPRFVLADTAAPVINPAYGDIVVLVGYLRTHTTPSDRILVGASSSTLNYDILHSAESSLYGREGTKLTIPFAPQVDSRDAPPLADLVNANVVIVAHPFQHHLASDNQKVVSVLDAAFDRHWNVSKDFTELPDHFALGAPGTDVEIYKRVRTSSPAVVADTRQHMAAYTQQQTAAYVPPADASAASGAGMPPVAVSGTWVQRSSPFPLLLTPGANGEYTFTGHPARGDQQPPTVIETRSGPAKSMTISGTVHFYDERCAGVEIAAGTDYRPEARGVSAGVFVPQHNDTPFTIVVPNGHRAVFLTMRANPATPQRIEFCTTRIDRLRTTTR